MKTKTLWYICLALILFGGFLMNTFNKIIGISIFGLAAYTAGAYHIKWKLGANLNEKTN